MRMKRCGVTSTETMTEQRNSGQTAVTTPNSTTPTRRAIYDPFAGRSWRKKCLPGLAVFHHTSLRAFSGGQRPPLEAGTQKEAISAFYTDAMKSNLLRDPVPGARQEAPESSALRLCRPACGRPPLRSGWGTPPLALAAPAGMGQGQGVFVSKHSTAIQKRRKYP